MDPSSDAIWRSIEDLWENGLLLSKDHTVTSLRHTFGDQPIKVEASDKIAAALMDHKYHRPRYGEGPCLAHKREWLDRIVMRPPTTV